MAVNPNGATFFPGEDPSSATAVDDSPPLGDEKVTLVVVPRERFSCTQESLESIFQQTKLPFRLVYVDGNSPPPIRDYLAAQARIHGFQLIRSHTFLSPNQARNLGLGHVTTPYVVFLDNDVIVSPGWLTQLVSCADETGAAIVGPLMCQDRPLHQTVHFAGGEAHIFTDAYGKRHLREKMYGHLKSVEAMGHRLRREPTELVEFHCMLVRTQCFEQTGPLDEAILSTKEHMDFCLTVRGQGESIYFEPDSVVTYVPEPPQDLADIHFYMLRWSDAWAQASVTRLQEKWQLGADRYFENTYQRARARRVMTFIDPLTKGLPLGGKQHPFHKLLRGLEKYLNQAISGLHARQMPRQHRGALAASRPSPEVAPSQSVLS
jgi:GT2 family glycosyltransferase